MTEAKKDAVPNADAPEWAIQERRIVLSEGGGTPEEVKQAFENYKQAKVEFDKSRTERITRDKEKKEKEQEEPEKKLDTWLATEPSTNTPSPNPPKTPEKPKSQEEIDLDNKMELEKKAVLEKLKKKHDAEIREVLDKTDFTTLDEATKKSLHANQLGKIINIDQVPKEAQQEALKTILWPDGKPIDTTKPLTNDQKKVVQSYQAKKYLEALAVTPKIHIDELEKKHPGIKKFTEDVAKITPIKPGDSLIGSADGLLNQETFFRNSEVKKEIIESIVQQWMFGSEIDPESKLGKELVKVIEGNVDEYISLQKWDNEKIILDDFMTIEDFKGLRDILGAGYDDLISHENLLGSDHEINNLREQVLQSYKDSVAAMVEPDPNDPKAVEEYQKAAAQAFTEATGLPANTIQKMAQTMSTRDNLSPLVRALADIFAPLGALMGGEVGAFWRNYLNESGMRRDIEAWDNAYGKGQSAPQEWIWWIENAEPGSIHAAARKYLWTTETGNPDLVREFHQSWAPGEGHWPGVAWCMSFVQHVLRKDMWFTSEQIGKPTAWAADGHKIGRHVDTKDAQPWDIIMVKSKAANSGRHIWFVDKVYPDGSVDVLGGNQGSTANSVRIDKYSPGQIAEIRTLQMPKAWESTVASPDVAKSSSEIVNYAVELTKKSRQEAIMWAEHCTDWVDRIYKQKTGRSVYEAPKTYNAVKKIPWWDYGGTAAPRNVVDSIRPGQHIMLDKPKNGRYNAGFSHSVIAIEKPVDGMAKVVSYPNGGKQPVVETYDLLWLGRAADKQGRVIRIQW